MKSSEIYKLMPKAKKVHEIEDLLNRLRQHDSVTKELQKENTHLLIACYCFDEAIEFCPSMEDRPKPTADIVLKIKFQNLILPDVNNVIQSVALERHQSMKRRV